MAGNYLGEIKGEAVGERNIWALTPKGREVEQAAGGLNTN